MAASDWMISSTIGKISEITSAIAAAIEEQGAATQHGHCEPTGRANARPMTGSAKQSIFAAQRKMDCFATLAMTKTSICILAAGFLREV
jgi:hypothetical protein